MKKLRLTIYILFFAFNIALFLFTIYMDTYDNKFELGALILPKIPLMKYGALIGVVLVALDFIMDKVEKNVLSKEIERANNELNAVKAQLFDKSQPKSTPNPAAESKTDAADDKAESNTND